jgi:PAS domain S-box-containing protein
MDIARDEQLRSFPANGESGAAANQAVTRNLAARQEAQEQLRRSEDRFRALASAVAQIVWTANPQGLVIEDLPTWRAYTGQSAAAIQGWGWLEAVHPDDRERTARIWQQAVQTRGIYETEYRLRRYDGVYRLFQVHGVPVLADDGRIREWVGLCTDISARRQTERRLAVQYALSRALAEAATIDDAIRGSLAAIGEELEWQLGVFWHLDRQASVLRCDQIWRAPGVAAAAFELLSKHMDFYPGTGLPGRVWSGGQPTWIADILNDSNFPRLHAAARVGLHGAFAFPVWGSSGLLGIIELFSNEIQAPDEDLLQTVATLGRQLGQFIERKQAEDALRASEARKAAILETALDAIITIDHEGRIVEFNPAAERMFGYSHARAIGQQMAELIIPPTLRTQHYQGLARYLTTGQGAFLGRRVETRAQRADGTEFPIELAITRIPGTDPPLFTGYIRDITERRQAEAALATAKDELAAQLADMTRLHELSARLLTGFDLKLMLQEVLAAVVELQHADMGMLMLYNREQDSLSTVASIGFTDEYLDLVGIVPAGSGACGTAIAERHRVIIEDVGADPAFALYLQAAQLAGYRAVYSTPLLALNGDIIGTIATYFRAPHRPSDRDIRLVELYAHQATELIDHARLYEEAQAARGELAARAAQLEAVIEAIADAVLVFDTDERILQMNAAARKLLAFDTHPSYTDYFARPVEERRQLLHMRDEHGQELPQERWPQVRILGGEVLTGAGAVDVIMRTPDGRDVQLSVSGAPVHDTAGQIIGAVVVCRDVTERRRLERRTHEALQALLAMAQALVALSDNAPPASQDPAPAASETARRLVELTRSVLGCQRISISAIEPGTEILHPLAIAGLSSELARQWWASRAERPLSAELDPALSGRLRANEVVVLDVTQPRFRDRPNPYGARVLLIAPMCVGDQLVGLLTLEHGDMEHTYTAEEIALAGAVAKLAALVVERERLLRERAEAQASELALREANRRMDEFLSIVSHELKTPLTSIKASVQLVGRWLNEMLGSDLPGAGDLAPKLERMSGLLGRMERQVGLQNRLVNDLLDVSRIQAGRLDMDPQPCDLAAIVREAVQAQRQVAPTRVIRLELPAGDASVPVIADADRIGQVVTNYLTNALKYSEEDRPVEVGLRLDGPEARVWVRDEGPGLTAAEQVRVWERFHRAAGVAVRSGSGVGLGLGLYISRVIIEQHYGRVGVYSAPGQGSTFWFGLSLAT